MSMEQSYDGMIRCDFGPLRPLGNSLIQITENDLHGMEIRMEVDGFGRITVKTFDERAMLAVTRAIRDGTPVSRLVEVTGEINAKGIQKLNYILTNDDPDNGIMGNPIKSYNTRMGIEKAFFAHGKLINITKRDKGEPVYLMHIKCGGAVLACACRAVEANETMRRALAAKAKGREENPWITMTGFGQISPVKIENARSYRLIVPEMRHFVFATGDLPKATKIDKEMMQRTMQDEMTRMR